jgi:hypothetical protein
MRKDSNFYFLFTNYLSHLVALKIAEISAGDNALMINANFAQNLNIQTRSATTPLLDDRQIVE